LSDSGGNYDDHQASVYNGGGVSDEDDNNEMKIGPCEMKISVISLRFHFMPHLIINHLKMDECLFLNIIFLTLFKEMAAGIRFVSEKMNEAMPSIKRLIWIG
jgi:hypothetical protein